MFLGGANNTLSMCMHLKIRKALMASLNLWPLRRKCCAPPTYQLNPNHFCCKSTIFLIYFKILVGPRPIPAGPFSFIPSSRHLLKPNQTSLSLHSSPEFPLLNDHVFRRLPYVTTAHARSTSSVLPPMPSLPPPPILRLRLLRRPPRPRPVRPLADGEPARRRSQDRPLQFPVRQVSIAAKIGTLRDRFG